MAYARSLTSTFLQATPTSTSTSKLLQPQLGDTIPIHSTHLEKIIQSHFQNVFNLKTTHRPNPPRPRPLPRNSLNPIHRAHKTKTPLPPPNIPLSPRQPRPPPPAPPAQKRLLPPTPAPTPHDRARKARNRSLRATQRGMQVCSFPGIA